MSVSATGLTAAHLDRLLAASSGATVLVAGDVMLDEYVVGRVERTSPEAPVPVVHVVEQWSNLGGAANVARQMAAFGARVQLAGSVGGDQAGQQVVDACRAAGIGVDHLQVGGPWPTTRKQRVIADRQQVVRVDFEEVRPFPDADVAAFVARLAAGPAPDVVVISDYAKGFVTDELLHALIAQGLDWNVPILVDPKSSDFGRYRGATLLKANQPEFEAAVGRRLGACPEDDLVEPGEMLRKETGVDHLVVTLGPRGMVVLDGVGPPLKLSQPSEEVFDVGGAGDTVLAMLALGLLAGGSVEDAALGATLAAGVVIRKTGVAVAEPSDLLHQLQGSLRPSLATIETLPALVADWRRRGRRIVFTNGCFDLLHAGHLHLLRGAASRGDVLVVGVNSDASVRGLKGLDRPLITEAERVALLGAVDCVDAVVLFDGPDPLELIRVVQPDVLVKGSDYEVSEIVGRELVEDRGGRVVTVPLLAGWSTTEVLGRIRGEQIGS